MGDKCLPPLVVMGVGAGILGEERELATAPASWTLWLTITLTLLFPTSIEAAVKDDMNSYISQYYNGPSSGKSVSAAVLHVPELLCGPVPEVTLATPNTQARDNSTWLSISQHL